MKCSCPRRQDDGARARKRQDRFTKRRLYQEIGADEYWVVDADAGAVEVWSPKAPFPRVETRSIEWCAPGAAMPVRVELPVLFREP